MHNTIKGSAGNLVEWYDVYVYTVFAMYFEAQFFDKNDENSTLYIYGIFAVTFIGIGLAIIVVTTVRGGAAFGYLMGFLFLALGVGRLYLIRRRR